MLFGMPLALDQEAHGLAGLAQNVLGIGNEIAAGGGAGDHDDFERLPEDIKMAAKRDIAAQDTRKDDNGTNKEKHWPTWSKSAAQRHSAGHLLISCYL